MNACNYIRNLFNVVNEVEVTNGEGKCIAFNEAVSQIIALVKSRADEGKKTIFIGNGGSAAIASHGALDFWKNGNMRAVSFNEASLITCIGNDFGYASVYEKPIDMFADSGDVLIAISSSGKSENILRAVDAAYKHQCSVITLSGFNSSNPLRLKGDINLYVPSNSYGYVELIHQIIIHMVVDMIIKGKTNDD